MAASGLENLRIGVLGATGAVGTVALDMLARRNHPAANIVALASARSAGKRIPYGSAELEVVELHPDRFHGLDVMFISASGEISRTMAPEAVARGVLVIDDSSEFRMDLGVPLVVPEVNPRDVLLHKGIIAIPNCSTTPLVMVLAPLMELSEPQRMVVSTYQSVSGAGQMARNELIEQSRDLTAGRDPAPAAAHPHQIAFNVIPQIDVFQDDGYTKEEHKTARETRKILHRDELRISSTCVRVPVPCGHSAAVHIEFAAPVAPEAARAALAAMPGVTVLDDPAAGTYPMPLNAAGLDDVFVGRIRRDLSAPNGLALWVVSDNLRKGAALNSIQIMDSAHGQGRIKPA